MSTQIKLALFVLIFMTCLKSNAQNSYIKAGVSFNTGYVRRNETTKNFLSWEMAYEKPLGKKWSCSLGFNYAIIIVDDRVLYNYEFTNYNKTFLLEGRYYFFSTMKGPFLQLGLPINFNKEVSVFDDGVNSFKRTRKSVGITMCAGLGLKYPITQRLGVELSLSITPYLEWNRFSEEADGFKKVGVKLLYGINKKKKNK